MSGQEDFSLGWNGNKGFGLVNVKFGWITQVPWDSDPRLRNYWQRIWNNFIKKQALQLSRTLNGEQFGLESLRGNSADTIRAQLHCARGEELADRSQELNNDFAFYCGPQEPEVPEPLQLQGKDKRRDRQYGGIVWRDALGNGSGDIRQGKQQDWELHVQPFDSFKREEIHKSLHSAVSSGQLKRINFEPAWGNLLLNILLERQHNSKLLIQRLNREEIQVQSSRDSKTAVRASVGVSVFVFVLKPSQVLYQDWKWTGWDLELTVCLFVCEVYDVWAFAYGCARGWVLSACGLWCQFLCQDQERGQHYGQASSHEDLAHWTGLPSCAAHRPWSRHLQCENWGKNCRVQGKKRQRRNPRISLRSQPHDFARIGCQQNPHLLKKTRWSQLVVQVPKNHFLGRVNHCHRNQPNPRNRLHGHQVRQTPLDLIPSQPHRNRRLDIRHRIQRNQTQPAPHQPYPHYQKPQVHVFGLQAWRTHDLQVEKNDQVPRQ